MRGARFLGVLVAAALLLAACGSSGSKSTSASTSASNGVASKSPGQILDAAVAAAESAKSTHVSGTVDAGGALGLDLDLVTGKGAAGTISQGAPKFKLIVAGGDFYFQGNRAFWLKVGHTQAAVQLLLGKWIREPGTSGQFASISRLTSIKSLMSALVHEHGTLTKGSATTVDGQRAIALHDARGGSLYVATSGKPYPLKVTDGASSGGGEVSFTQYNHTFTIVAPRHSVNAAQLQQGGT